MTEPHGLKIFDEVRAEFAHLVHHEHPRPQYHDPATPAPEAPVSLLDTIRTEISDAVTWGEDEFRSKLPTIAKLADDGERLATSNAAQAVLSAVLGPADEQLVIGLVQRLDQGVHNAEQAAAGADVPAADVPGDPGVPVPAGPVVGGQAQ